MYSSQSSPHHYHQNHRQYQYQYQYQQQQQQQQRQKQQNSQQYQFQKQEKRYHSLETARYLKSIARQRPRKSHRSLDKICELSGAEIALEMNKLSSEYQLSQRIKRLEIKDTVMRPCLSLKIDSRDEDNLKYEVSEKEVGVEENEEDYKEQEKMLKPKQKRKYWKWSFFKAIHF